MAEISAQDVDAIIETFQTKVQIVDEHELGNRYEPVTSEPITQPLRTLDEVLLWKSGGDEFNVATEPLAARTEPKKDKPCCTLLCHDMMGGYTEDRFIQGVPKNDCYRYYHWQYLDMFIYFSHHFVTIPPPSWTNAAHKNGVLMLGTVITEWTDGAERCKQVFASESAYKTFADKLVAVAKYYKFDGWLINIENPIAANHMPQLVGFVEYLTKEMHTHLPGSKVIWYDSVIIDGSLKWQDMLNEKNRVFFDTSDGIFLNYTWNESKLQASLKNAAERKNDVYVGVDVFGRNCFGGGGWNTDKAMKVVRSNKLSAAIFAPGWVMEKLGREQFIPNQNKYWGILDDVLSTHGVTSLPFVTNFCRGYGDQGFRNGKAAMVKSWCNLSAQQIQPTFLTVPDVKGQKQSMEHCVKDGYNGGGSLLFKGTVAQGKVHTYRVFETGMTPIHQLLVSYTVKCSSGVDACAYLDLEGGKGRIILWATAENSEDKQTMSAYGLRESEALESTKLPGGNKPYGPLIGDSHKNMQDIVFGYDSSSVDCNGWQTRHYLLPVSAFGEGSKIAEIGMMCSPSRSEPPTIDYVVRLGELKVINPDSLKHATTQVTSLACVDSSWHKVPSHVTNPEGQASFCCTLQWEYPHQAMHYDVYVSGVSRDPNHNRRLPVSDVVFIGRAYTKRFRVCHLLVPLATGKEGNLEFQVQPTTGEGLVAPFQGASKIKVVYS